MKKIIILFIVIIEYSCSNNENINNSILKLKKSESVVYTIDQIKNYFKLINDSVYSINSEKPFTGQIQIIGKIQLFDNNGYLENKEGIIAIFNIDKGGFIEDQIFLNNSNQFIKTKIIPNLDVIKGIDFIQVNENEIYDYSYGYPKKFIKVLNKKFIENIKISKYHSNGNLMIEGNYLFNFQNYILSSIDESIAWQYEGTRKLILNNSKTTLYHYNNKAAYEGNITNGQLNLNGKFMDLNGNITNSDKFFLSLGGKNEEIKNIDLNIEDIDYKYFRNYFSSSEIKLNENLQPHIETEEEKSLRIDELIKNKSYDEKDIIGKSIIFNDNFDEYKGRSDMPSPINIEIAEFDFLDKMSYNIAIEKCKELGNGWRLPTILELNRIRIHKIEINNFKINSSFEDNCWYWSSNMSDNNSSAAKVINMSSNFVQYYESNIDSKNYVRAVKSR